jgi:hypothetical protein
MLKHVLLGVCAMFWLAATAGFAADYTQPEHDAEYTKASKRQDTKMDAYFGDMLPAVSFAHEGRFRVLVTRNKIERRLTLVPIKQVPYASLEELKSSVWGNHLPVGYLDLPYANLNPALPPGSFLLVFDGLKIHLLNSVGYEYASFPAEIELPGAEALVAKEQGGLDQSKTGLAYITPQDELLLYLQFSDAAGKPLRDETGYAKALVRFSIPGLTEDETGDRPAENASAKADESTTSVAQ